MGYLFSAVVSAILAAPLSVYWQDPAKQLLVTSVQAHDDFALDEYLERGLTVTYRFYFRVCRKRSNWLDHCGDETLELHKISFDPLTEVYSVTKDRLGDEALPEIERTHAKDDALKLLFRVDQLSLKELAMRADAEPESDQIYLNVRLESYSLEEGKNPVEWLSYLVTFGLVDLDRFDTGWVDFTLKEIESAL